MNLFQWTPTIIAIASVIGMAFVAHSTLQRHESDLAVLRGKIQHLETTVAVLKATRGGGVSDR